MRFSFPLTKKFQKSGENGAKNSAKKIRSLFKVPKKYQKKRFPPKSAKMSFLKSTFGGPEPICFNVEMIFEHVFDI